MNDAPNDTDSHADAPRATKKIEGKKKRAAAAKQPAQVIQLTPEDEQELQRTIRPLGHNHGIYYYFSAASRQVVPLTASQHGKSSFLAMAPLSFWGKRYPGQNGGVYWDMAASDLLHRCHNIGVYNPDRVRGRGAWFDNGRSVVHLGDQLWVDGKLVKLSDFPSWFIYEAGKAMQPPSESPLAADEAAALLRIARRFRWLQPVSGYLLAGWVVCALICGALDWRPHIWVTGGAGTGKTTVANRFIRRVLAFCLYVQGDTTEAGLRQWLGFDALPVVFDEAESNDDPGAQARIAAVLGLMRQSSSETGGVTLKGSAAGQSKSYVIRSAFALVSISPGIKAAADHSRISFLTLTPAPNASDAEKRKSREEWEKLSADLGALLTPGFMDRLFARAIRMIPIIRMNADVFATAVALHFGNQRIGDQLGTLLAGSYSLFSDGVITLDKAREFIGTQEWSEFHEAAEQRDEESCLRHLLQSIVRVESLGNRMVERSIAELCLIAIRHSNDDAFHDAHELASTNLRRHGLRIDGRTLFVANSHLALAKLFQSTAWAGNWKRQLSRLPFATTPPTGLNFLSADGSAGIHGKPLKSRAVGLLLDDALALA